MYKQWIGCGKSNFLSGRSGFVPEAIVIHGSGGPLAGMDARCSNPNTYNSSHYAVGVSGEIHQYVEEKDTAFQAGVVVNPTWKLIKPFKNPNLYTLGIEQEKLGAGKTTEAQYQSLTALILEIAQRWNIALDVDHIVLHDEIRAGAGCPGSSFDRSKLLNLLAANTVSPVRSTAPRTEVTVLKNTNIRESPKSSARIVRITRTDAAEGVLGFDDCGERISGNAIWYRTEDGSYLWAGATDKPNPVESSAAPLTVTAAPLPVHAIGSGISFIDNLFSQAEAPAIREGAAPDAVGAIQDLLTGHGFPGLPTVVSTNYGIWSPKTISAVQSFQKQSALPIADQVDKPTLQKMIDTAASDARASRAYLTLVLNSPFTGLLKILSLVAQMEGAGRFSALNRNTDRAGLSFGLIQWAQKPGRLAEMLRAMSTANREQFVAVFGGADPGVADALVANCSKPCGGIDPKTGDTVNAAFSLIDEPWITRFRRAALSLQFQQVQVQLALDAFTRSSSIIRRYAPDLVSERAIGFMLDVANQFGDSGAERFYTRAHRDGMRELDVLEAIADESVAAMGDSLKTGVRARRDRFLETPFLSETQAFGT